MPLGSAREPAHACAPPAAAAPAHRAAGPRPYCVPRRACIFRTACRTADNPEYKGRIALAMGLLVASKLLTVQVRAGRKLPSLLFAGSGRAVSL